MKYFYDPDNGRVSNERNETVAFCDSMTLADAEKYLKDSQQIESDAELEQVPVVEL